MVVCRYVHMHTKEKELWIFSFVALFHSGCMHPPGDDGVVDGFRTFQLWSLHSKVQSGGKEFVGTSLCLRKDKASWGVTANGVTSHEKVLTKSLKFKLLPTFHPSALQHPSSLYLPVWPKDNVCDDGPCSVPLRETYRKSPPLPFWGSVSISLSEYFEEESARQLILIESLLCARHVMYIF